MLPYLAINIAVRASPFNLQTHCYLCARLLSSIAAAPLRWSKSLRSRADDGYEVPVAGGVPAQATAAPSRADGGRTAGDFARVVARVEPTAEAFCREEVVGAPPAYCDFESKATKSGR